MKNGVLGIGYSLPHGDDFDFKQLAEALDEADRHQPDFVELALFSIDVIASGRVLPEQLKRLKALTTGRGYGYTLHAPLALNLMVEEEQLPIARDVLKACLEVGAELGAVHIVVHTGIFDKQREHEAEALYARQRDILAEAGELAANSGLIIAVENLYPAARSRRTALPSRLAKEIAAIGHPAVQACLDFSHAFVHAHLAGADKMAEVAAIAPFARHLHVHDSFGRMSHRHIGHRAERLAFGEGDLHLPLGLGALPWDKFMSELRFPAGVVFNLELAPPYWSQLAASLGLLREMAARASALPA